MSYKICLVVLYNKNEQMTEEQLYRIMASRLSGERLTDEEDKEFQMWLNSDDEHCQLYEVMQIFWSSGQAFRGQGGPDREEAFRKIAERSFGAAGKRRAFLYRWAGVAAVLLLLVGVTFIWQVNNTETGMSGGNSGSSGMMANAVRLELSNGECVDLSRQAASPVRIADVQQAAVVCDSNSLSYIADDEILSELPEYNTLVVPAGAEYRLLLSDGTRVYLNAASELRYPTRFTRENREVFLKGEAYFEVSSDTSRRFIVRTTELDVLVYGTSFDVNAYEGNREVVATLTSGKIKALCRDQEYELVPGQQLRYDLTTGNTEVEEVRTEMYTCWKDGYYYFEAVRLEDIMQMLSHWYNIEAFFVQSELREIEFTGRLRRYENVEQLFRKFEQTRNIRFDRKGNSVVISGKV